LCTLECVKFNFHTLSVWKFYTANIHVTLEVVIIKVKVYNKLMV
jgi:hypothetical protein